jgi:hypothetical protein
MQAAREERWKMLCALAADEQDPQKLLALVHEINDLLEEKERKKERKSAHRSEPSRQRESLNSKGAVW